MNKPATYEDVIRAIGDNYGEIESSIVNQLLLNVPMHYPTQGSYRENVWKQLFQMIIPKKYCIEKGVFIIDSYGNKSKEVDLAVFDELYTPYIFNYGEIKFIPIEAVAAVVQCKSARLVKGDIVKWKKSIDALITSMDSVARMAANIVDNNCKEGQVTQTATRPLKILCAVTNNMNLEVYAESFDIVLTANENNKKLSKIIKHEDRSFDCWNKTLNHYIKNIKDTDLQNSRINKEKKNTAVRKELLKELEVKRITDEGKIEENVIFSLILQLNQLLMVLNNPMLFPHRAYAKKFTEILETQKPDKGENKNE